jgi:hypothetical protein
MSNKLHIGTWNVKTLKTGVSASRIKGNGNRLLRRPKLPTINPFSGGFIIASHIYKGEFPLSPAGI